MEKDEQNPDLEQEQQDEDIDFNEDDDTSEEDRDWEAEAKKYKAISGRLKKKLDSSQNIPTQETKPETKKEHVEQSHFQTVKEIAIVTKELNSEELETLELKAQELGVDPVKFARTSVWKDTLASFRSNQKKQSSPSPSGRAGVVRSTKFAETLSSDDTTPNEKQAAFEAARDEALSRRK